MQQEISAAQPVTKRNAPWWSQCTILFPGFTNMSKNLLQNFGSSSFLWILWFKYLLRRTAEEFCCYSREQNGHKRRGEEKWMGAGSPCPPESIPAVQRKSSTPEFWRVSKIFSKMCLQVFCCTTVDGFLCRVHQSQKSIVPHLPQENCYAPQPRCIFFLCRGSSTTAH